MATDKSVMAVIRASRPGFRNGHDKVAFVVHASFLNAGFVLTATGPPAFADNSLSSSSSSDEVGIEGWNEVEDEYAFLYVNPDKGNKKVLVKCLKMGDQLMVDALSDGSEPVHLEISVADFVAESGGNDYNSQYQNLDKLLSLLDSEVLSKLDGSSAGSHTSGPSRSRIVEEPNNNNTDGSRSPHNPPAGFIVPPVSPFGSSDLFPGPGAGMYPPGGDFGGGSMLLGPNDPRWFGGRGVSFPGEPGGLGIPPGARYDPINPPGVPGFDPDNLRRYPRGPFPDGDPHPDLAPRGTRHGGRLHPDLEQPGSGGSDYI